MSVRSEVPSSYVFARLLRGLSPAERATLSIELLQNIDITLLESTLGNLAHMAQYATITVTLKKKITPGPLGWIFYGVYKVVEWLFIWP